LRFLSLRSLYLSSFISLGASLYLLFLSGGINENYSPSMLRYKSAMDAWLAASVSGDLLEVPGITVGP
jgi:hypothetical protein